MFLSYGQERARAQDRKGSRQELSRAVFRLPNRAAQLMRGLDRRAKDRRNELSRSLQSRLGLDLLNVRAEG